MLNLERQNQILSILKSKKMVSVHSLSKMLYASTTTIRRDLIYLEKKGLLKRTFGGATIIDGFDREIPMTYRENVNMEAKSSIAKKAAELISDNSTVIMDSSSTVLQMVPFLSKKNKLTIITNGLKMTQLLADDNQNRVYCTGGLLRENSLSFVGTKCENFVKEFNADILFFSCRGISIDHGITDSSEQEAELRKKMISSSKVKVLLCDKDKIDVISFANISFFSNIDYLITDQPLSYEWQTVLDINKVKLIVADYQ